MHYPREPSPYSPAVCCSHLAEEDEACQLLLVDPVQPSQDGQGRQAPPGVADLEESPSQLQWHQAVCTSRVKHLRWCPAALAAAHILELLRPPIQPATGCLPLS